MLFSTHVPITSLVMVEGPGIEESEKQNVAKNWQRGIRDLKQDDAFNRMWWPVLSTDKCCQMTSLSVEITDNNVLLKLSCCLRSLLRVSSGISILYDTGRKLQVLCEKFIELI